MKKIIVLGTTLAAVTTATTVALVSKAKKVKAEKAEAIELEKIAADIDATTETADNNEEEMSWEDSHETYESESVPVTDEEEIQMCEDSVNTYDAEEENEEEAEEVENAENIDLYQIYVEYCPKNECGDACKTKHDTKLKFGEIKYTGIFVRKNKKDVDGKALVFDWKNHAGIIEAINYFFEYSEWLHERNLEFVIDFMGYDWGSPLMMGHVGNDPEASILIRANHVDNDNIF